MSSFSYDPLTYSMSIDISSLNVNNLDIISISSTLPTYNITISSYIAYSDIIFLTLSSYTISNNIYYSNFINVPFNYYAMTISSIFFYDFQTVSGYIEPSLPFATISDIIIIISSYISDYEYIRNIYSYFSSTTISSSISGIINYNYYGSSFNTLSSNIYNLIYEDRSNKLFLNTLSWMINDLFYFMAAEIYLKCYSNNAALTGTTTATNILLNGVSLTFNLLTLSSTIFNNNVSQGVTNKNNARSFTYHDTLITSLSGFVNQYIFNNNNILSLSSSIYNNYFIQGNLINNIVTSGQDQYARDLILTISNKLEGNNGVINYLHDLGYNAQYIKFKNKILLNPTYAAHVGGYTIPSNVLHIYTDSSGYLATNQNIGISLTNPIMDENMYPVAAVGIRCNTYKNCQGYFGIYPFGASGFSIGVNNKLNNSNVISKLSFNNGYKMNGNDLMTMTHDATYTERPFVGVGNFDPQFTLDVSGTFRCSDNAYFNSNLYAPQIYLNNINLNETFISLSDRIYYNYNNNTDQYSRNYERSLSGVVFGYYYAQEATLFSKAPKASPALTGTPTAPTATTDVNNTQIATTAFVKSLGYAPINNAMFTGPVTMDNALDVTGAFTFVDGNLTSLLALKAPLYSPTFTNVPRAPTATVSTDSTQIATCAYVKSQGYATLNGPAFTNTVTAPTPDTISNNTQVATCAFVKNQYYLTTNSILSISSYLYNDLGFGAPYLILKKKMMIHPRWNGSGYSNPSGYINIISDVSANGGGGTYKNSGINITNVAPYYPMTFIAIRNTYNWQNAQVGVAFDLLGADNGYSIGINNLNNTTNTISKFSINNGKEFDGSDMMTINNYANFTYRPLVGIGNPNPQFTMDISGTCRVSNNLYCNSALNVVGNTSITGTASITGTTTSTSFTSSTVTYCNYNVNGGSAQTINAPSAGVFIYTIGNNYADTNITCSIFVITGGGTCHFSSIYTPPGWGYTFTAVDGDTFTVSASYPVSYNNYSVTYTKVG